MPTISNQEFDARLCAKLHNMTAEHLLFEIPSILDEVSEYYNNQIIEEWEADQAEDSEDD